MCQVHGNNADLHCIYCQAAFCGWTEHAAEAKASRAENSTSDRFSKGVDSVEQMQASMSYLFDDVPLVTGSAIRRANNEEAVCASINISPTPLPCPFSPFNFGEATPKLLNKFNNGSFRTAPGLRLSPVRPGVEQDDEHETAYTPKSHSKGRDVQTPISHHLSQTSNSSNQHKSKASIVLSTICPLAGSDSVSSHGVQPPALPPRASPGSSSSTYYSANSNSPFLSATSLSRGSSLDHLRDFVANQSRERSR